MELRNDTSSEGSARLRMAGMPMAYRLTSILRFGVMQSRRTRTLISVVLYTNK